MIRSGNILTYVLRLSYVPYGKCEMHFIFRGDVGWGCQEYYSGVQDILDHVVC
jgi:hypothetical protein